jgi:TetR/AcrR family transcriptional regulator, tetracycline repressor protein
MAARLTTRGPLSRCEIVRAALELAESDGMDKLSLNKLAAAVGVKTMSLYHHVADKSDLLDAMADQILAEVDLPDVDVLPWQDGVRAVSESFRRAALRYPHSAPLVLVRRLNAPTVLPVVDASLRTLRGAGLDSAEAVHTMRAFIAFLVGSLLREVGSVPDGATVPTVIATPEADLIAAGMPAVAESAAELSVCDHDAEMEFGVELLVESVRQRLAARP